MKKRNSVIILAAFLGSLVVSKNIELINAKHLENKNTQARLIEETNVVSTNNVNEITSMTENALAVVEAISSIDETKLDASYKYYILEILNAYHSLTNEEKTQVGDSYNLLVKYYEIVNKAVIAQEFDIEFNYLLNDSTFAYVEKLNELKEKYNTFDETTKAFVNSYNEENIAKIQDNGTALTPDIYYDFTNAVVDSNKVINQGTKEGKDATLMGNASVANGYLEFGSSSKDDSSCLKLPSDLFSGNEDFTLSFIYEKEDNVGSDERSEIIYTLGTNDYHNGSGSNRMGIRAYYASWNTRGSFHQLAHKNATTSSGEYGHGPQLTPEDYENHKYKITVRYLSKAQCIQVYQIDLHTGNSGYFNFCDSGTNFSNNNYMILDTSNFDLSKFTENYLGARNGYSNGSYSFKGKFYSFRFYSSLVTDREMYGTDDRNLNIGQIEALNYINNFEKIGPSFEKYKDAYAPIIDKYYKIMISCPYDYQKFFDSKHVEYFMEAYNIIHADDIVE